jgi:hypothetical protein
MLNRTDARAAPVLFVLTGEGSCGPGVYGNAGGSRAFAMIGCNYICKRLLLPVRAAAIMMAGATEDANADFFPEP